MAGPNVGSISVTVVADTSKLHAKLVRDGKIAGEASAKQIEKALQNLNASIAEIDGEREAQVLRKQMEVALRGIDVGLDFTQAREDLKRFDEEASATNLAIDVELNRVSLAEAEARLTEMTAKQREVFFEVEMQTLEADADLERIGKSSVRVEALVELDRKLYDAQVERIRRERVEATVRLKLEKAAVEAELARLDHLKRIDVPFGGDFTALNAELAAESRRISTQQMNVNIGADTRDALLELLGFKEFTEKQKLEQSLDLDTLAASIAYDKFLLIEQAKSLDLDVDMELTTAEAQMVAFRRQQAADDLVIDVDLKTDKASASGDALSLRWKAIIAGIVLLAEPAAVALEGLLGPAIQIVSSGFSALSGGVGAATPIFAAFGAVIGGIAIGMQGMGGALKAVSKEFAAANAEMRPFNAKAEDLQKAMQGLSPAAKDFAFAWATITPAVQRFQDTVSEKLFADLADTLQRTAKTVLPDLAGAFGLAASSANEFFRELASTAEGIDFTKLFAELKPAVDDVFDAIRSLVGAVEPLFQAIAPASRILAQSLKDAAESLADLIGEGAKSGALEQFFIDAVHSLQEWGRLAEAAGDALFTLFQAGTKGGDGLIRSLTDIVSKFDEWMESVEGQEALTDFFNRAHDILSDMTPLLEGVQGFFENLVSDGAIGRFGDLTEALGQILPMLGSLLELIGRVNLLDTFAKLLGAIADALIPILPDLQKLADAFGDSLGSALELVVPLLAPLAEAIGFIARVAEPLAPLITGIAIAVGAWSVFTTISQAVYGLATSMIALEASTVFLAALAVTVGIVFAAFHAFGAEEREVSARAAEVARVLEDQVNVMLDTAEAGTAASLGVKALSKALTDAGGDGEKLTNALGTLGKTTEDSLDVLLSFGKKGENADKALRDLAKSAGISGKGFDELIAKVRDADDPFFGVSEANTRLAKALNISTDELAIVGHALEEVQDQAKKTDLDKMIQDFLAMTAASSDVNMELLEQAENTKHLSRSGSDLIPLYEEYTKLLAEDAIATRESNDAKDGQTEAQKRVNDALAQGKIDIDQMIRGGEDLDFINGQLVDSTGAVVGELTKLGDFTGIPNAALEGIEKMNTAFEGIALNARLAARRAQGFADQQSLLIAPGRNVTGALISVKNAIADTDELLAGGSDAASAREKAANETAAAIESEAEAQEARAAGDKAGVKSAEKSAASHRKNAAAAEEEAKQLKAGAKTLDLNTKAGLENMDSLISQAEAIETYAEEMLAANKPTQEVLDTTIFLKAALENQAKAFGASDEEAVALADTLVGMPDTLKIAIEKPNLLETTDQVADLGQAMIEIPTSASTTFVTPGLPETKDTVEGYRNDVIEFPTFASTNFNAETEVARTTVNAYDHVIIEIPTTWSTTFNAETDAATAKVDAFRSVVVDFPTFASTDFGAEQKVTETRTVNTMFTSEGADRIKEMFGIIEKKGEKDNKVNTLFTSNGDDTLLEQILGIKIKADEIKEVEVNITAPNAEIVEGQIGDVDVAVDGLTTSKTITITAETSKASTALTNLQKQIDAMKSKSISITVNQTPGTTVPGLPGGTIPGDMAGELITHPTIRRVGERGLREAIIPLQLPLNRVDPSVRALAELLRGGGAAAPSGGIARQVNNYMTITPQTADPAAIATQLINRAAALATR